MRDNDFWDLLALILILMSAHPKQLLLLRKGLSKPDACVVLVRMVAPQRSRVDALLRILGVQRVALQRVSWLLWGVLTSLHSLFPEDHVSLQLSAVRYEHSEHH